MNPEIKQQWVNALRSGEYGGLVVDWTETWSQNYSSDYVFCNNCIFRKYF